MLTVIRFDVTLDPFLALRSDHCQPTTQKSGSLSIVGPKGSDQYPTNNLLAGERHIRTAIGRDYADVPPTRGVFKGKASSELKVSVRVAPSDAPPPPEAEMNAPPQWEPVPEVEQIDVQEQQQQQ
jgi:hypothetical protein